MFDHLPAYFLEIGEVAALTFLPNPELKEQGPVHPDGGVYMVLILDKSTFGRTATELTDDLSKGYQATLINPQISATLRSILPSPIYVSGEVNTSGKFITVGPTLSISQAITRAGSVNFSSDREKIFGILRGAHDVSRGYAVDYIGIIRGSDPQADIRLGRYEVLNVACSGVGDAYNIANQYLLQFVPVRAGFTALPVTTSF